MVPPGVSYTPLDLMPTNRFDDVHAPDAVHPAHVVEVEEQVHGVGMLDALLRVHDLDRGGVAEVDHQVRGLVGGVLQRPRELEHVLGR